MAGRTVAGRLVAGRLVAGRTVAGRLVAGKTMAGRLVAGRTTARRMVMVAGSCMLRLGGMLPLLHIKQLLLCLYLDQAWCSITNDTVFHI